MLKVIDLKKHFGKNEVLKGVSLEAVKGEIVTILGPSGSGKSTLLRCINFLETANGGTIQIGEQTLDTAHKNKRHDILALRRQTAMVFQDYNLFKNKTALENVMEPLIVVQKLPLEEARKRALINLGKVGLTDKNDEYPSFLSGGQQQRVGIARALAQNPTVILFDEPTSSLDPELVGEVLQVMRMVAKEGITMIVVTHEMSFASEVADKVVVLVDGLIAEQGTAREVFTNPQHERTKQFLERITKDWNYSI